MSAPVKVCPCCDRAHDAAAWLALKLVGYIGTRGGVGSYEAELRNCVCGSTIALERSASRAAQDEAMP